MRVKFTGYVDLPFADDRGSYDIWLLQEIVDRISAAPETDEAYEALEMEWELSDDLAV